MPNSRQYTSTDVKNLFDYAFPKIDFKVEGLTRDTGCTIGIEHTDDIYVKATIKKLSEANDEFEYPHNSHDWIKILKYVFQNAQIISFENINIFKEWKEFSAYSRKAFTEKENIEKTKEYVLELKKFMAKMIHYGAAEEVNCIHLMLHLAYKVYTSDETKKNTSQTVANMLGSVFYDSLQLEGIVKCFKLADLDIIQKDEYIDRIQKSSSFFKDIIEDPLFSKPFNKVDYIEYLATSKEDNYGRNKQSLSTEEYTSLDPEFIESWKNLSLMNVSKSAPDLSTLKQKNTEVTFSYKASKIMGIDFNEEGQPLAENSSNTSEASQTKHKKRLSLSMFQSKK